MKITLKQLLTATTLGLALIASPALAMDKIKIATEGAYAPWNYKDSGGNLIGFEVDLAKELCTRMEVECEIVEQAWDGIIPALVAKKYDVIMAGMSIKAKREKVISFSRNYADTPILFASLKSNDLVGYTPTIPDINLAEVDDAEKKEIAALATALKGKTVGVQGSTTHEDFMKQYLPDVALKTYDTMDNMILDLEAERIDAGYTSLAFLHPAMKKNPEIAGFGPGMNGGPLGRGVGAGLRQGDTELREKFTTAINAMIDDGSLSKMAVKWFDFDASARK